MSEGRARLSPKASFLILFVLIGAGAILQAVDRASSPAAESSPSPTAMTRAVSAGEFGARWPFAVASGALRCDRISTGGIAGSAVVFRANGIDYALNGFARSWADARGYADVDRIWLDDLSIAGAKVSVGPLIDIGLTLCAK